MTTSQDYKARLYHAVKKINYCNSLVRIINANYLGNNSLAAWTLSIGLY